MKLWLTFSSYIDRVVSSEGPMFTAARYETSLPENAAEGTPVVRVEAASPSGEPVMYTIVAGNTEENFVLDYSTGKTLNSSDTNLPETICSETYFSVFGVPAL